MWVTNFVWPCIVGGVYVETYFKEILAIFIDVRSCNKLVKATVRTWSTAWQVLAISIAAELPIYPPILKL